MLPCACLFPQVRASSNFSVLYCGLRFPGDHFRIGNLIRLLALRATAGKFLNTRVTTAGSPNKTRRLGGGVSFAVSVAELLPGMAPRVSRELLRAELVKQWTVYPRLDPARRAPERYAISKPGGPGVRGHLPVIPAGAVGRSRRLRSLAVAAGPCLIVCLAWSGYRHWRDNYATISFPKILRLCSNTGTIAVCGQT